MSRSNHGDGSWPGGVSAVAPLNALPSAGGVPDESLALGGSAATMSAAAWTSDASWLDCGSSGCLLVLSSDVALLSSCDANSPPRYAVTIATAAECPVLALAL